MKKERRIWLLLTSSLTENVVRIRLNICEPIQKFFGFISEGDQSSIGKIVNSWCNNGAKWPKKWNQNEWKNQEKQQIK